MSYEEKKNGKPKDEIIRELPMTYDDYAALDDGKRYELADGKLELMSPGPSSAHQLFSFELQKKLAESCESQYFVLYAPLDVILSPTEVRQPDIMMLHRSRVHLLTKRGIVGPPDLVVEILSPYTHKRDRLDKLRVYAQYSIPEYWLIDPVHGTLEQFTLQNGVYQLLQLYTGDDEVRSEKLTCVSFTMAAIMSNIPDLQD